MSASRRCRLALALATACTARAPAPAVRPISIAPSRAVTAPRAATPGRSAEIASSAAPGPAAPTARPFRAQDGDVERACAEFARTYCARTQECTSLDFTLRFGDTARCIAENGVWCERELLAPDSGFSRESLGACRQALSARACRHWRRLEDLPIAACHPTGSRRFEEPCFTGVQCVSGFCARKPVLGGSSEGLPAACGTCAPVAALDDRCAGPSLPFFGCPVGAMCSRGLCIGPFSDEGDECGAGAWYQTCYGTFPQEATPSGLECPFDARPKPVCRRRAEPARCDATHPCNEGRFCDPKRNSCAPKHLARPGEPCGDESIACVASAVCDERCIAPAKAGAACDRDHACEWPATCVEGTCILLDPGVCTE